MSVSFLDLFKKRVLPIAFICGMAVLIQNTCNKQTRTHATIVLDLGDAAATVRSIDAELRVDGESNAQLHRKALDGLTIGPCRFKNWAAFFAPMPGMSRSADVIVRWVRRFRL